MLVWQTFTRTMYATQISIEQPIEYCPAGENNTGFVWVAPAPQLVVGELKELADANGVEAVRTGGYWIGPRLGAVPAGKQACAGEKVVYHVHAAIIDAIAGYRYLVQEVGFEPQNIILSGDSAGGGWGNTHVTPNSSMHRNALSDFIQPVFLSGYTSRALVGNLPLQTAARSVWISPGSLDLDVAPGFFAGLPLTCIFVGDAEVALDQVRALRDRIRADNGENTLKYMEWTDVTHVAVCMFWHEPERTMALREIAEWLDDM
ncbi:hypothetical protein IEO21_09008 [Rhodonia placenta]|uniref:Alpha/beta hydrolase fold-3 domain-containing protein n=1 Tax=Rhodonia placenta TaxID=104341 RepID=A0A8H7NV28_9APHY|nr:hypothetical protein IEO21_09008 [Postia placenta]